MSIWAWLAGNVLAIVALALGLTNRVSARRMVVLEKRAEIISRLGHLEAMQNQIFFEL